MHYILDCRYHTTWQSEPSMSWLLRDIKGKRALLEADRKKKTDTARQKRFWTDVDSLIWCNTPINNARAKRFEIECPDKIVKVGK